MSWSTHLDGEATIVRMAQKTATRQDDPPTERLDVSWRGRLEDVLNAPEWTFSP